MPARKRSPGSRSNSPDRPPGADLDNVFAALCRLLEPFRGRLASKSPNSGHYYMESLGPTYRDRPMYFAGVRSGKNYVSYHLMPVAASPRLREAMSQELKKRMQGKACFNFRAVDQVLFEELKDLTEAGYEEFRKMKYL